MQKMVPVLSLTQANGKTSKIHLTPFFYNTIIKGRDTNCLCNILQNYLWIVTRF